MKPLFIPLKREHYEAFERGDKTVERRVHGARWHLKTCTVGRPVVLSLGYGKARRLEGVITAANITPAASLPGLVKCALIACYGELPASIIEIHIKVLRP